MAFWGLEVKPGKPFTHKADDARGRLHISQATLGIGTASKKSIVQCNVGNKSPVFLCSLFPEKAESCQLNLEFEEADEVVFSVIGPLSIHLTGYFLGPRGRHYNLSDESESYGEDIAESEPERSSEHSDNDKYDDSFINDDDPGFLPPSPLSDGAEMEEISGWRKPNHGKGSRRRLRKKFELSECDDDVSAQNHMSANETETPEKQKPNGGEGNGCRFRKKYQLVDSDDDVPTLKQNLANGSTAVTVSDHESEDLLPISSLCKGTDENKKIEREEKCVKTNPSTELEAEGNTDHRCGETSAGEAKDGRIRFITSQGRSDDVHNSEPRRPDLCDSMEVGSENGVKPKKKKNVHSKKVKHLEIDANVCSNVLTEKNTPQNDIEADRTLQNLSVPNVEYQKTSNYVENVDLPPVSQLGSVNDTKPKKKKRKELAEEEIPESGSGDGTNVIKRDKGLHDEVLHDGMDLDIPGRIEQTKKQATAVIPENEINQSLPKKKKKKRTRTGSDMKVVKETPPLSVNATEGSTMDTENSSEVTLSQSRTLPSGVVIQELETGKPDGKVAASGKKISVQYTGKLKENGQVFDSNLGSIPLKFRLGRKEVIEGLNIGLEGMRVGEKRRLIIPPSLGYGNEGDNSKNIPPSSWLEFDVDLIKVHR